MQAERRFKDSLPPEFRITNLLIENLDLLSEPLKAFVEDNIDNTRCFLSIFETLNEQGQNPPIIFVTAESVDVPLQRDLSDLGNINKNVILPDNIPALNSEEKRVAKEISETVLKNTPAKIVEIGFKFATLANKIRSEYWEGASIIGPVLEISNPQNLLEKRTLGIFTKAKSESARKDFIQGDRFERESNRYYHDMDVYKNEIRKRHLELNKKYKGTIKKYGLGKFLKEQFEKQIGWEGETRNVPIFHEQG